MKIAFYSPHLGLRGTEVAMYDYAFYNREILGNESVILYQRDDPRNHESAIEKFNKEFKVIPMYDFGYNMYDVKGSAPQTISLLNKILIEEKCDAIYMCKGGTNDGIIPTASKVFIQAVGIVSPEERHGDRYAFCSKWLSEYCSSGQIPVVPHMIDLPEHNGDLRSELGIPKVAVVFGRTGGMDTWNLPFASEAVIDIVNDCPYKYFVFQNTPVFYEHPQIKYIKSSSDLKYKVEFINTCDAMLHARYEGESFGITCGEFSIKNKPVITWSGSRERNHIDILGESCLQFTNKEQLTNILRNFIPEPEKDWNMYKEYSPAKVMGLFKKIFID